LSICVSWKERRTDNHMDVNKILSPAMGRIIADCGEGTPEEPEEGSILDLLDPPIQAVKGPRKRTGMDNPCFTIFVLSNPRDEDTKAHNGTLVINFYADNYQEGHANIELLGPVAKRIVYLFDDKPFSRYETTNNLTKLGMTGYDQAVEGEMIDYVNYNLAVAAPEGPLHDPDDENAHFMHVRINFGIMERSC